MKWESQWEQQIVEIGLQGAVQMAKFRLKLKKMDLV